VDEDQAKPQEARTAAAILTGAAALVGGDRARTHGDKVENHRNIAILQDAFLKIRRAPGPLGPLDAALMMVLLKIARTQTGAYNPDDYADMAGYAAVAGEIAARGETQWNGSASTD
jgi:hypothetical protein